MILFSQCQFVKSKGEEVLLVAATATDLVASGVLHKWQGLGVCVCWGGLPSGGWQAQLSQHEGFITPPTCVTEKVFLAPTQLLELSSLSPSHSLPRWRVTTSECKQRWGLGGVSAEAKSPTRDMWVEKHPVLGRHLGFSQACLCLTFLNNLTLTRITVGAIKAGGQGAQESSTLPIGVVPHRRVWTSARG